MSWRWSRLTILAFLMVLYAAPLSSGDKGLWLSVAALPVQTFGAIPSRVPPEHAIVLPDRGDQGLAMACVERREPAPGLGVPTLDDATLAEHWERVGHVVFGHARDAICPAPSAPRGPPA